nr:HIT domain-containing protein [Candidatus Sigynarchaeota archaeon]
MAKKQEAEKHESKKDETKGAMTADCIFCKIVDGKIPSKKFYEDNTVIAFLDINPAAFAHSLVVPKLHFKTIVDGTPDQVGKTFIGVKNVTEHMKTRLKCDGFNILINQGREAGQIIEHFHIHVVPRFKSDNIRFIPPDHKASDAELDQAFNKLK